MYRIAALGLYISIFILATCKCVVCSLPTRFVARHCLAVIMPVSRSVMLAPVGIALDLGKDLVPVESQVNVSLVPVFFSIYLVD